MWLTIIIAGGLFAALTAAVFLGYSQTEAERNGEAAAVRDEASAPKPGHCLLCDAPFRKPSTADEVVFDIEHRIDTELKDVVQLLRQTTPDGFQRLYRA